MIDVRRFGEPTTDLETRGNQPGMNGHDMLQRETLRNDERRTQRSREMEQELRDRGAAFSRALSRLTQDGGPEDAAPADTRQLLFTLDRPPNPFTLLAAESARTAQAPTGGDAAQRIATLVEAAAAEQARQAASAGTTIAIPVDGDGLQSVTLAISADGVDVTLTQVGETGTLIGPDMARDLAERLQARLGRRRGRIYQEALVAQGRARPSAPSEAEGEA